MITLGAANRDPEQLPDPDRLDVTRQEIQHIGWGSAFTFALGRPSAEWKARLPSTPCFGVCQNSGWPGMTRSGGKIRYSGG